MNGENQEFVTDEPDEFEKLPVDVRDFVKVTNHVRRICKIHVKLVKENRKITTCNQLNLETLGSGLIMHKNLPGRCPFHLVISASFT